MATAFCLKVSMTACWATGEPLTLRDWDMRGQGSGVILRPLENSWEAGNIIETETHFYGLAHTGPQQDSG